MSIALLAQHSLLVREGPPVAPAPAPAPPPSPAPPPVPPAFAISPVDTIYLTKSIAIVTPVLLADIVTAETVVRVDVAPAVPGCAFALVGSPPTQLVITGTPATASQVRLSVTYVRNDGSNMVLGGSIHTLNIIDPATLFVGGLCANLSARVGEFVDVVLATPTIALNVEAVMTANRALQSVFPAYSGQPRGDLLALAWTAGATSSGTLRAKGIPMSSAIGSYTLTVSYWSRSGWPAFLLGTTTHDVTITDASTPAPAPPAPAPAPPAPAPAPVPSPPPSPPRVGSDPLYASVLLLHRFNPLDQFTRSTSRTGYGGFAGDVLSLGSEASPVPSAPAPVRLITSLERLRPNPYRGDDYDVIQGTYAIDGNTISFPDGNPTTWTAVRLEYTTRDIFTWRATKGPNLLATDCTAAAGASGEAVQLRGGAGLSVAVGGDFAPSAGTLEMMVNVDDATGLWAAGTDNRWTPLLSLVNPEDELVWSLGLARVYRFGIATVRLALWRGARNRTDAAPNEPVLAFAPSTLTISRAPGRFIHVAGQWSEGTHACWWDGGGGSTAVSMAGDGIPWRAGAVLRLGGSVPSPRTAEFASWTIAPLWGAVDESRITAVPRYTITSGLTVALPSSHLLIPFPGF
jgi:hypothetical protein